MLSLLESQKDNGYIVRLNCTTHIAIYHLKIDIKRIQCNICNVNTYLDFYASVNMYAYLRFDINKNLFRPIDLRYVLNGGSTLILIMKIKY